MREEERQKWSTYIIWAPRSLARPSQARGASLVTRLFGAPSWWPRRVNGDHGRTAEQGEGVGRRPSNVHCVEERLAGPANEEKRGRLPKGAPQATFQKNASFQTCLACVNVGP